MAVQFEEFVTNIEIGPNIATELNELLYKQRIRQEVLIAVADDPDKFNRIENELISIMESIDKIKNDITESLPDEYRSNLYQWEFRGLVIDGNNIRISKASHP